MNLGENAQETSDSNGSGMNLGVNLATNLGENVQGTSDSNGSGV